MVVNVIEVEDVNLDNIVVEKVVRIEKRNNKENEIDVGLRIDRKGRGRERKSR